MRHGEATSGIDPGALVVRDLAGQTHSPGRHGFTGTFLSEPGLDPAIAGAWPEELEASRIRQIVPHPSPEGARVWLADANGHLWTAP